MKDSSSFNQFVMVSYDVTDDRRRRKVSSELENFGTRVQFSVFECHLDDARLAKLRKRLGRLIDASLDRVAYYVLCSRDEGQVICEGPVGMTEDWDYRII